MSAVVLAVAAGVGFARQVPPGVTWEAGSLSQPNEGLCPGVLP